MIQINDLKTFQEFMKRYEQYTPFFRGQSRKYPNKLPSVGRDGYLEYEANIYNESITRGKNHFSECVFPIDYLSKMQHYGIPTRLVDFTINPKIALYFAVEDNPRDEKNKESGYVYTYIPKTSFSIVDKQVRLLSLLATIEDYSLPNIIESYKRIFQDQITANEVTTFCREPVFLKFSDELKKTNKRLINQDGTFFICGNQIKDGRINHELSTLDSIVPMSIICVPYEYKKSIRDELHKQNEIDGTLIYPELPSLALYIKNKYIAEAKFMPDDKYIIVEERYSELNKTQILIIGYLKDRYTINQLKIIVEFITNRYAEKYLRVRVDLSLSERDVVFNNWVIQSEWIKPGSSPQFIEFTKYKEDGGGYRWKLLTDYENFSEINEEYYTKDNAYLFVCHVKLFSELSWIFCGLESLVNSNETSILDYIRRNSSTVSRIVFLLTDFEHSSSLELDNFLDLFQYFANRIDFLYLLNQKELTDFEKVETIKRSIISAQNYAAQIEDKLKDWRDRLQITEELYLKINPYEHNKKEYKYQPTLPISENPLIVTMESNLKINIEKRLMVEISTNLFDGAKLMLLIYKDCKAGWKAHSDLVNGKATFGPFSDSESENPFPAGSYTGIVSLIIPGLQREEFINYAGIEYEKLGGPLVKRNGIGSTLEYNFEFIV